MSSPPIAPHLSAEERDRLTEAWNGHPGMRHMGVRVDLTRPEIVRVYVDPVQPYHRGGMGTEAVNGVVMSGVFDLTIGLVGHLSTPNRRVGTAQLNIQFIRPVLGDRFEVHGRLVRAGRTLIFAAADLYDQEQQPCARCDGIVAVAGELTSPEQLIAL